MKKAYKTRKDKLQYWFDNKMTKGSFSLIRLLMMSTFVLMAVLAGLMIFTGVLNENENDKAMVNSLTTVINAQTPEFSETSSIGYIVLLTLAAVVGVFFTSVLIGIITNAIENKLSELRKGNSLVLESGHTVILGFTPGEYTLIQQLILAADGKKDCIVVADSMERDVMENYIFNNLDVPKNFRIICRSVDIFDPQSISKCAIESSKTVIINPMDDSSTIKTILAVSVLLQGKEMLGIGVNALLLDTNIPLPDSLTKQHKINMIQTNNTLARMIAHSCTQKGLSDSFREIFNFEGCEFYVSKIEKYTETQFYNLMYTLDNAVPLGIVRDGDVLLNPSFNTIIKSDDEIIYFAENDDSYSVGSYDEPEIPQSLGSNTEIKELKSKTVIIGHNESLGLILQELPEDIYNVTLADYDSSKTGELERIANKRKLKIDYYPDDISKNENLTKLVSDAAHIVLLNNHELDAEEADMKIIFYLLNLKDIRMQQRLDYNITAEMREEKNQKLVLDDDHIDFLVSSKMSSLILTQLAESPELIDVYRELLTNEGNEVYLKNAASYGLMGTYTVQELRCYACKRHWIMLGYMNSDGESIFNPSLNTQVTLKKNSNLIVISET